MGAIRNITSWSIFAPGITAMLAIPFLAIAAWITHVVWIVKILMSAAGATAGQIALGALGAFMPPIGVIHGIIIWFS